MEHGGARQALALVLASLLQYGCVGQLRALGEDDAQRPDGGRRAAAGPVVTGSDAGARAMPTAPTGPVPDPVSGAPFWRTVTFESPVDMGHSPEVVPAESQRAPGAVALRLVASEAGLDAAIGGGNTHGVGIAFLDVDGDGYPDIYVANGHQGGVEYPSLLYRNDRDGTFSDVTSSSGVQAIMAGRDTYSVAAGDYDADGDVDLYVGAQPHDVLLQNRGDGTFVDATTAAHAGGPESDASLVGDGKSKVTSFGDFDADGWLDLVSASSTLPAPGLYVLRNRGDGTFEDVTAATGAHIQGSGNPCAVMWSDYDTDGDVDLWIWNDRGGHVLLRNDGATFSDATHDGTDIGNPMGIDSADIDHDMDLDYYVSNIGAAPLLQNVGDGSFTNITNFSGTMGEYTWGLGFVDLNLDTWADIFVAQEDDNDHLVFTNQGMSPPWFERTAVPHPDVLDSGRAHNVAVAFADYDRDGRVDVVLAGTDGRPIMLYRNETDVGSNHWLDVRIRATTNGARGGVSGRVVVKTGDLIQFRDISGGSSRSSQNELSARFGLGQWTGVEWVAAVWPSGDVLTATLVEGNQTIELGP